MFFFKKKKKEEEEEEEERTKYVSACISACKYVLNNEELQLWSGLSNSEHLLLLQRAEA